MLELQKIKYAMIQFAISPRFRHLPGYAAARPRASRKPVHTSVKVNVRDEQDAYVLALAAPGLQKEDFHLKLDQHVLSISAEAPKGSASEGYTRQEFDYRGFERSFQLPEAVDEAAIAATYEQDILRVRLPKKPEAQPVERQIAIA